jgi:hypothetical protein
MLWGARLYAAMRAALSGRIDDAERLAHEAVAVAEGVVPLAAAMFAVQIMWVRREQGRLSEVEPGLRAFVDAFPAVRSWRTTLAAVLLEIGAEAEARAELGRIAAAGEFLVHPDDYEWPAAMTMYGEALARIGDAEGCATVYRELLPYADRTVVVSVGVGSGGPIARHLGLMAEAMGDTDAAAGHFDESLAVCRRLGAQAFAVRTSYEYGRMLQRTAADPERGRDLLRAAVRDGDALGLAIAADARALLDGGAIPFVHEGDAWRIGAVQLRDAKGLRYLAELIGQPGTEIAAAELAGAHGPLGDSGPAIDASAKRAYRRRIDDLRSEQDDAQRWNDPERAARAQVELDALAEELSTAVGLNGRDRRPGSPAERARVSVTKAIKTAIKRIHEHDPELADYLRRNVKTGAFCLYDPPARDVTSFRLK